MGNICRGHWAYLARVLKIARFDAKALGLNRAAQVAIHGAATVAALANFYDTVVMLFDGSKLGGATLTARKPAAS